MPEPGWYEDPLKPQRRRWWDGENWTDQLGDESEAPATNSPTAKVEDIQIFYPDPTRPGRYRIWTAVTGWGKAVTTPTAVTIADPPAGLASPTGDPISQVEAIARTTVDTSVETTVTGTTTRTQKIATFIVCAFIAGLLIAWIAGSSSSNSTEDSGASAGASLACRHFRNVVGDIRKGILTAGEVRSKVQEVYDDASVADEADVAAAAETMLRLATADEGEAFIESLYDMDAACDRAGE